MDSSSSPLPRRTGTVAAILLTLAAAALHVYRALQAGALWRDEAGAVQLAMLPTLKEVLRSFPHEAFPPLFSWTVRAWATLTGGSDLALRLFGLAVGLAILGALWLNARAFGTVPLVSVALVGFHPFFVIYGDSLRGYGLGTLLILLTLGGYARLIDRQGRRSFLLAAVPAVLGAHVLFHDAALLLGLGTAAALVGLIRKRWRLMIAALSAGLLAAVSMIFYIRPLAEARAWDVVAREPVDLPRILATLTATVGYPSASVLGLWGLALTAGVVLFFRAPAAKPDIRLFLLLAAPAAFAAQLGLFLWLGYLPRIWYWLPLMAVTASALDGLLIVPDRPLVRAALPAGAVLAAALLLPGTIREARVRMTNVDAVAAAIEAQAGPRDLVLVNPWFCGISFRRYYRGPAPWRTVPDLADHRMHRYDLLMDRMRSRDPIGDLLEAVRTTLASGHRVWVAGSLNAPQPGQAPPVLGPAPEGSPWGWQDAPYSLSWTLQLGACLREHASQASVFEVPSPGPVSNLEHLWLHVFEGWH